LELLKLEFTPKALKKYISTLLIPVLPLPAFYLLYYYLPTLTCCLHADMGFNKDKKKKLANLFAKRRAAAAGVGTSTPTTPPPSATSAPNTTEPAPVDDRQKGVVVIDS